MCCVEGYVRGREASSYRRPRKLARCCWMCICEYWPHISVYIVEICWKFRKSPILSTRRWQSAAVEWTHDTVTGVRWWQLQLESLIELRWAVLVKRGHFFSSKPDRYTIDHGEEQLETSVGVMVAIGNMRGLIRCVVLVHLKISSPSLGLGSDKYPSFCI